MKIDTRKKLGLAGFTAMLAMAAPLSVGASTNQTAHGKGVQSNFSASSSHNQIKASSHNQVKASSEIIGMDIQTTNGEKIGEVSDIFIDLKTGRVLAVGTSTGEFLGLGGEGSLLSTEDLRFDGEKKNLRTDLTKDQLLGASRYNKGETPRFESVRPLGKSAEARQQSSNRSSMDANDSYGSTRNHGNSETGDQRYADSHQDRYAANNMGITELVGMDVENMEGENVGSIDKLFLDLEQGQVLGVVVSTGGFLGMGAHQNVLALNELKYHAENETLQVDLNQDQLRSAPTYTDNDSSWQGAVRTRFNQAASGNWGENAMSRSNDQSDRSTTSRATVFSQGNSSAETQMTADIRKSIIDSNSMSSRANNVTIITQDKRVLLRGEVDSAAEKSAIEKIAHTRAGRTNVTSELTVRAAKFGALDTK